MKPLDLRKKTSGSDIVDWLYLYGCLAVTTVHKIVLVEMSEAGVKHFEV